MTDRMMRKKIKDNVLETDPEAEVWLYGSRVNGTAREITPFYQNVSREAVRL